MMQDARRQQKAAAGGKGVKCIIHKNAAVSLGQVEQLVAGVDVVVRHGKAVIPAHPAAPQTTLDLGCVGGYLRRAARAESVH